MSSRKQAKLQKLAKENSQENSVTKKVISGLNNGSKLQLDENDVYNVQKMEEDMKETKDNLHFEDEYDDVFEEEDVVEEEEENSDDYESIDDDGENQEGMMQENNAKRYKQKEKKVKIQEDAPYVGTGVELGKDECLDFENCTYEMLHRSTTEWPCMSIDFLLSDLPFQNSYALPRNLPVVKQFEYPLDVYAVAGSMASVASKNQLYVLKFSNLMKTKYDDDSVISADDDEILDDEPVILHQALQLKAGVNRVRSMGGYPIVAVTDEHRKVSIFDIRTSLEYLKGVTKETPKYDLKGKGEPKL